MYVHMLCFGDHPDLARRCLDSIIRTADWAVVACIRVALAKCCEPTRCYVHEVARAFPGKVVIYDLGEANPGKYSVMRRLFYGTGLELLPAGGHGASDPTRSYLPTDGHSAATQLHPSRWMWFDDDSFILPTTGRDWWFKVWDLSQRYTLIGAPYRVHLTDRQMRAIREQPWYTGRRRDTLALFKQGGWWVADPLFLKRWDYPFPELCHNGGDVMLGQLCLEQRQPTLDFLEGYATNADASGVNSSSKRRGMRTKPLWTAYDPAVPASLAHHVWDFAAITDYSKDE